MSVAIIYASHHGHTRAVCERLAEGLRGRGVASEIMNVDTLPESFSLDAYDAAILAGAVHYGRHPKSLVRLASAHRYDLDALPTVFVSVSLASADPKAASQAQRTADGFAEQTGWQPGIIMPVAGALPYSRYNPLLRLLMRQIARVSGGVTDTKHDHVYTDWEQVDALAARVGEALHPRPPDDRPPPQPPH